MEYVDLYLVHWPVRLRNEAPDKGFRGGGCCSIGHEKGKKDEIIPIFVNLTPPMFLFEV